MSDICKVHVNNKPADTEKYVVCSVVDGALWYWGSWDDEEKAEEVAGEIGGLVTEVDADE